MALAVPQLKADEVTVANGTTMSYYVPIDDYHLAVGNYSQIIYPSSLFENTEMPGCNITGLKFYYNTQSYYSAPEVKGTVQVSLGETDNNGYSSATPLDGLTNVYSGQVSISGREVSITFDEAFPYDGSKNLVVEIRILTATGSGAWVNAYGQNITGGGSVYQYSTTSNYSTFVPKTTFSYEEGTIEDNSSTVTPKNLKLEFGKLAVGDSKTMNITLKNTGANAFTPSVNVNGNGFSSSYTAIELNHKESATIPVVFSPNTAGDFSGTVTIDCGLSGYYTIELTGNAAYEKIVADGTDTNYYLPVYGNWYDADNGQVNQMIYPASMLSGLSGKRITSMTFYSPSTSFFSGGKVKFSLANLPEGTTTFSSATRLTPDDLTQVYYDEPSVDQVWTVTFASDVDFVYDGKNLLLDVITEKGSYKSVEFYGQDGHTSASWNSYNNGNASLRNFLPKVTFTYEDAGPRPVITATPTTLSYETEVGTSRFSNVAVTGENLTEDITATISGTNASYFAVTPATLGTEGGTLKVDYNPTEAGEHTATLTLSSAGAQPVEIALNGTATATAVPTLVVNPATVTINTEPNTTGTATFTVTGTNLTNDITLTASNGFTVTPTTIAAADAANGVTVTVAYPASNVGTFNGTITLRSNGATEKTVSVTADVQEIVAEGTVTPTSLDFGEVLIGQTSAAQLVKVSNTGSDTFTPSFSIDNPAFSIDEPTAIAGGTSISYNVTFTPTAAGTQTGTLTVSFGGLNHTVSLVGKGTELAGYDITSSEASGVHNFGDVFVDGVATWNVKLTNNGANAVTPVIEGLAAPFSAENVPATLASGESATITFKFAPTAIQAYGPTSVVVKFNETEDFQFDYTLRGNGIENTGTLPPSTFDNETYTWTDDNGDEHTSPYSEIATDPNQMIALLKAVYTNKNLPGNYYRGYTADKTPQDEVAYPAIGAIERNYTSGVGYTHDFYDAYGWGMAHDETAYPMSETTVPGTTYTKTYYVMNPNEYKPNQEGVTLLLVEMKDGVGASTTTTRPTSYASLKNLYGAMFKSVRVIPNSKKVTKTIDVNGTATQVPGTLFKVDCDKMNRFFFLAKGRLRFYPGEGNASAYFLDQVKSSGGGSSYTWYDKENTTATVNPFNMMYEQFSPVDLNNAQESKDVYQLLINMQSYDVEHDCEAIPWASTNGVSGHEFNMYGKSSISEDCQDVRDLMFFVPDYRMMYWSGRDKATNSDEYTNYYKQFAPNMGMYVIRQNEITGERNGEAESYTLHLSWESNLTDFVPGENGEYTIYLVNADGTYTVAAQHIPSNQTTYDLTVNMAQHGQQVTYVIQGQDNTGFLSLQFSNEESFIIPGLDANEKFQMMTGAEYYSRFDPKTVQNFYANGMQVMAYPDATTSDYAGTTFNYYRKAAGDVDWTLVGTAQVNNAGTEATVSMVESTQRQQSEYKFGYKQNPATVAVTTDAKGIKVFGVIFDNFKADVSTNAHPTSYSYKMEVANTQLHSNEMNIKVYRTQMSTIAGTFTYSQVEADENHQVGLENTAFDIDVEHSSKTDILRYGAYRWDSDDDRAILDGDADAEVDISPSGQASNQGEYYSVYMNGDSFIGEDVYVAQGETRKAKFEDNVPETAPDEYTYAPVVETFTGRADYNTYGAPLQSTATGKLTLTPGTIEAPDYTFTTTADGRTGEFTYYTIPLGVTVDIPTGFDIYKVRAWRQVDMDVLGEEKNSAYTGRRVADYLFETNSDTNVVDFTQVGETEDGTQHGAKVYTGTFGAKKVTGNDSFDANFIVRVYFTRNDNLNTGSKAADGKYYIAEAKTTVTVKNVIYTGVNDVDAVKEVAGVKYYNLAGMESNEPFSGVNIIVTRYTDGSISTSKVMR